MDLTFKIEKALIMPIISGLSIGIVPDITINPGTSLKKHKHE